MMMNLFNEQFILIKNNATEDDPMKIRLEKGALVHALQKVQNVTEKKTNMPILSNTLIRASDQQTFELFATDLELSLKTQIPVQVEEPGSVSVSARKLLEIIRELPQDEIMLEMLPNERLSIRAGRSHFQLATIPAEDFPHMNFYEDIEFVSYEATVLKNCLNKTSYSIPTEEDPFSVAGLFWHPVDSEQVRFVASDGHRLAYVQISGGVLNNLKIGKGIVIPRKGVQEMLRLLDKENEIFLGAHENCLIAKTSDTLMSMQLLEAEFPEYQLIIPEERPFVLRVKWEDLYHALKRMAILTNQKWRHVRFVITAGSLQLESGDPEIGNAKEVLDIDYEGEDFTVAFNIRYLLDAVQSMDCSQVRFEWVDQYHGGVFLGEEDSHYLTLIMPMVV